MRGRGSGSCDRTGCSSDACVDAESGPRGLSRLNVKRVRLARAPVPGLESVARKAGNEALIRRTHAYVLESRVFQGAPQGVTVIHPAVHLSAAAEQLFAHCLQP